MNNWSHVGFIIIGWLLCDDASNYCLWLETHKDASSPLYVFCLCLATLGLFIGGNSLLTILLRAEKEVRKRRVNMVLNTLTSQDTIKNDGGGE